MTNKYLDCIEKRAFSPYRGFIKPTIDTIKPIVRTGFKAVGLAGKGIANLASTATGSNLKNYANANIYGGKAKLKQLDKMTSARSVYAQKLRVQRDALIQQARKNGQTGKIRAFGRDANGQRMIDSKPEMVQERLKMRKELPGMERNKIDAKIGLAGIAAGGMYGGSKLYDHIQNSLINQNQSQYDSGQYY